MADQGYKHEFILAALLSRTMTYYVFKAFRRGGPGAGACEADPRPVGVPADVEFSSEAQRRIHDDVAARARKLLDGEVPLGGPDDKSIELLLHEHQAWTPRKGMFAPGVDGLDTRIESLSGVERGL